MAAEAKGAGHSQQPHSSILELMIFVQCLWVPPSTIEPVIHFWSLGASMYVLAQLRGAAAVGHFTVLSVLSLGLVSPLGSTLQSFGTA